MNCQACSARPGYGGGLQWSPRYDIRSDDICDSLAVYWTVLRGMMKEQVQAG
jgi:hypothetical protein